MNRKFKHIEKDLEGVIVRWTPLVVPSTATRISSAKEPTTFNWRVEARRIARWTTKIRETLC